MSRRPPSFLLSLARRPVTAAVLLGGLLLAGCDGEKVEYTSERYEPTWTWIRGDEGYNTAGIYEDPAASCTTRGVPLPGIMPGARDGAVHWIDDTGAFWLFGGIGYDVAGNIGRLNDLWVLDASGLWTWVGGSCTGNGLADYGSEDVAAASNQPGGRSQAIGWADAAGNLWLFGGQGYDDADQLGRLNDLWKFDGSQWTWVDGDKLKDQGGSHGNRGTADPANVPGSRLGAVGWVDDAGALWLFGGHGYDGSASLGWLNDLWKFDGTDWTWVRGAATANAPAVYVERAAAATDDPATTVDETIAVTAADLTPGGRQGAVAWHLPDPDTANAAVTETAWVFGGEGNDAAGAFRVAFNEMWRFDGVNWLFVRGDAGVFSGGSYGGRGLASLASLPPSRSRPTGWAVGTTLWMFGGAVETSSSSGVAYPNDLWRFDGGLWTWVGGSNSTVGYAAGSYPDALGGQGVPAGRQGGAGWVDDTGGLWLFGGAVGGTGNKRDDLWFIRP